MKKTNICIGGGTLQNKIGFTLIELLAVIVILAIIALIATPIVLNIIKEAKKSSTEASMKMIERAAELYFYNSEKREEIKFICSNKKCISGNKILELEGNTPELGIIKIDKNGKVTLKSILMNGYNCNKNNGSYKCYNINKKRVETQEYMIHINDNKLIQVADYRIYGNNVEESETQQINKVGDLVTNSNSEHYGKYEIKIKVVGKNLFDKNSAIPSINWDIISYKYYPIYVGEKSNVTVSYQKHLETGLSFYFVIGSSEEEKGQARGNWIYHSNHINLINKEQSFISKENYIYLNIAGELNNIDTYILQNNFQIELSSTKTEYEPYKEQIYSIYLDEPLGKNDYIDFKTGTIVRDGIQEEIQLPEIYLNEDISNIIIDTEIKPSKIELEYYK